MKKDSKATFAIQASAQDQSAFFDRVLVFGVTRVTEKGRLSCWQYLQVDKGLVSTISRVSLVSFVCAQASLV